MYISFEKSQEARVNLLAAASKVNSRLYVTRAPDSKPTNTNAVIAVAIVLLLIFLRR